MKATIKHNESRDELGGTQPVSYWAYQSSYSVMDAWGIKIYPFLKTQTKLPVIIQDLNVNAHGVPSNGAGAHGDNNNIFA